MKAQFLRNFIFVAISGIVFFVASDVLAAVNQKDEKDQHLFPGTGFFKKNREPYESEEAKKWFSDGLKYEGLKDWGEALDNYEKFAKRPSTATLNVKNKTYLVGPESLYRAARIREAQGDWQKAFNHLHLIARAYTEYDFEMIAESLMRLSERLANEKLPKKWGVVPRFRSGNLDRSRLGQIAELARGPKFAPRALMALAEIALKDKKEEEAVDALERIINLYPENYLCEKAYFDLATIYDQKVSGPSYDQGSTLKALNFYEDYLILFPQSPVKGKHESMESYAKRKEDSIERRKVADLGRKRMRQVLASSKVELGEYVEKYGKYYMTRWKELGNRPALQFYNEAITTAPESEAARIAEKKVAQLRGNEN